MQDALFGLDLWLRTNLLALFANLFVATVILVVGIVLAGVAARATVRGMQRFPHLRSKQLLINFLARTARITVLVLAGIVALGQVGVDVWPFIAGIGVAGFIVGFAFKDSLSNMASGILLLFYQPFDIGDFVEAGGTTGSVLDMSVVATELRTPDGRLAVVPNSRIWNDSIINFNKLGKRRIEWTVGVSYDADIGVALETLQEVLRGDARILDDPAPHFVVDDLADSSVNLVVRAWVEPGDFLGVTSDTRRAFKEALDVRGLEIPFPQRVVHQRAG